MVFVENNCPSFNLKAEIMSFLSVYLASEVFSDNADPSRVVVLLEGFFNLSCDFQIRNVRVIDSLYRVNSKNTHIF